MLIRQTLAVVASTAFATLPDDPQLLETEKLDVVQYVVEIHDLLSSSLMRLSI